jgi:hypothetical protein
LANLTNTLGAAGASALEDASLLNDAASKSLFTELESKLGEFDLLREKEEQNRMAPSAADQDMNEHGESGSANGNNVIEPLEKDYALRQAQMQVQLTEYDSELAKKELIFRKMVENNLNAQKESTEFDISMQELKTKINALEKEKEELQDLVRNADSRKYGRFIFFVLFLSKINLKKIIQAL